MSSIPDLPATTSVYQLRVVLNGISPLIWRRLVVSAGTTIAELHAVLQTAFGWSGEHLHRFVIHGREYGISSAGGPGFRDDARQVRLGELGLRLGERFSYEYNYCAVWEVHLRVEEILPSQPGPAYPRCVGGRRAGPPEDWGGPWEFVERTQPYLVFGAVVRAAEIVGSLLAAGEHDIVAVVLGEGRDELATLLPLLGLELFDRPSLNQTLAQQAIWARSVA